MIIFKTNHFVITKVFIVFFLVEVKNKKIKAFLG